MEPKGERDGDISLAKPGGDNLHSCTSCRISFPHINKLIADFSTAHQVKTVKTSQTGARLQVSKEKLLSAYTGKQCHSCSKCGEELDSKAELKVHLLSHPDENSLMCLQCNMTFARKSKVISHLLVHPDQTLQNLSESGRGQVYACAYCGKQFPSEKKLKGHLRVHKERRLQICQFCSKEFKSAQGLKEHIQSHMGENLHV